MKYFNRLGTTFTLSILVVGALSPENTASAAFLTRFQATQKGGFVLVGNTLAHDADAGVPSPIVGTIGATGTNTSDGSPDVFWRSDSPASNQAIAHVSVDPWDARSTANVALPLGSTITHAQLYWSGRRTSNDAADRRVAFSRNGGFNAIVNAPFFSTISTSDGDFYQSSANVTNLVQSAGPGTFRLQTTNQVPLEDLGNEVIYAGWSLVVAYSNPAEPTRQITIRDGLDLLSNSPTSYSVTRPSAGIGTAQLGIVVYEGDPGGGDSLRVNGNSVSNALNPANDVFNMTYSRLGASASSLGDLPQLTGFSNSMSGIDIDTFDVTPMLGNILGLQATYTAAGVIFNGVFVTALPVIGADVPEPSSLLLLGLLGTLVLGGKRFRG